MGNMHLTWLHDAITGEVIFASNCSLTYCDVINRKDLEPARPQRILSACLVLVL